MQICIDSCVFIRGLQQSAADVQTLIMLIGAEVQLVIPRLVAKEVTRNLQTESQLRAFYHLFSDEPFAHIVDTPVPPNLVAEYVDLGLPAKADAFIGAFAAWQQLPYLISDNRHFLRDLQTDAFKVLTPLEFVMAYQAETL